MLAPADGSGIEVAGDAHIVRMRPSPLPPRLSEAEAEAHAAFVSGELGDNPVWNWR